MHVLGLPLGLLLLLLVLSLSVKAQASTTPDSIEVTADFDTQLPPGTGAPVCLTGGAEPIGRVSKVRLLPAHERYHDGWEVLMEVNKRDTAGITTDAVVSARAPEADRNCGGSREVFLDINVLGGGSPISDHSMLKGEVTYLAEIEYMVPTPWWQRAADFVAMDIGVIWIELTGGVVIFMAGTTMLGIFVRRRARRRRRDRESINKMPDKEPQC